MSERGLHGKYIVVRTDGKTLDGGVFVLSPETDIHAMHALATYQESVEKENPALARGLGIWLTECGFIHQQLKGQDDE